MNSFKIPLRYKHIRLVPDKTTCYSCALLSRQGNLEKNLDREDKTHCSHCATADHLITAAFRIFSELSASLNSNLRLSMHDDNSHERCSCIVHLDARRDTVLEEHRTFGQFESYVTLQHSTNVPSSQAPKDQELLD